MRRVKKTASLPTMQHYYPQSPPADFAKADRQANCDYKCQVVTSEMFRFTFGVAIEMVKWVRVLGQWSVVRFNVSKGGWS